MKPIGQVALAILVVWYVWSVLIQFYRKREDDGASREDED